MGSKKTQNSNEYKKLYMVVSPGESNAFYSNFAEAMTVSKRLVEENDEDVSVFEITRSWTVNVPEEPEPYVNENPLSDLVDDEL